MLYEVITDALRDADIALSGKSLLLNPDWVADLRTGKPLPLYNSEDANIAYTENVITSYSIHYTKLYEQAISFRQTKNGSGTGNRRKEPPPCDQKAPFPAMVLVQDLNLRITS